MCHFHLALALACEGKVTIASDMMRALLRAGHTSANAKAAVHACVAAGLVA